MSYQVLARQFRPKQFKDVVAQDHVKIALQSALNSGRIGHAYLFSGTRGIGKTTLARIFARSLRCTNRQEGGEPCLKCEECLSFETATMNVIEIDGASNNTVESIRELIDNAHYLPTSGEYKIYVIDEVHMLSASAFNALLKTLEEPPAHVIFIFATTEPGKIPATVLSRCQRFDLHAVSNDELILHVENVLKQIGIEWEGQSAIELLVETGQGSVRDTLSSLDQVINSLTDNKLTEKKVSESLGLPSRDIVEKLLKYLFKGESAALSSEYRSAIGRNIDGKTLSLHLLKMLAQIAQEEAVVNSQDLKTAIENSYLDEVLWLFEVLSKETTWVFSTIDPTLSLEMVLLKMASRRDLFLDEKKKIVLRESKIPVVEQKKYDWNEFLEFVKVENGGVYANISQGNKTHFHVNSGKADLEIAFRRSSRIFYDYFQDQDSAENLKVVLAKFIDGTIDKVNVSFVLVQEDEVEFQSVAEIDDAKEELKRERIKKDFLDHDMVRIAEDIFDTKIDRVLLKDE